MKKFFKCIVLVVLISTGGNSFAQIKYLQKETEKGNITFARFRVDLMPQLLNNSAAVFKEMLPMQKDDEWKCTETIQDEAGFPHQYFQQYYKGIRVVYGTYAMQGTKEGYLETAIGNFQSIGTPSIKPSLSESEA